MNIEQRELHLRRTLEEVAKENGHRMIVTFEFDEDGCGSMSWTNYVNDRLSRRLLALDILALLGACISLSHILISVFVSGHTIWPCGWISLASTYLAICTRLRAQRELISNEQAHVQMKQGMAARGYYVVEQENGRLGITW